MSKLKGGRLSKATSCVLLFLLILNGPSVVFAPTFRTPSDNPISRLASKHANDPTQQLRRSHVGETTASPVTYSSDTTLSSDIQCTDLTINPGVTVTTNSFNIYCSGNFANNGIVTTGFPNNGASPNAPVPGGSNPGGSVPSSYGGSGAGGEASIRAGGGIGGSTLAPGGMGGSANGNCASNSAGTCSGATPYGLQGLSTPVIQSWSNNGFQNYLEGAGGGSGATGPVNAGGWGSSGGYGIYIQAATIVAGKIVAHGQPLPFSGSQTNCGGTGGGGVIVLAYSSGLTGGTYDVNGGTDTPNQCAGEGNLQIGGKGQVFTYNYGSTPPVQVGSTSSVTQPITATFNNVNGGSQQIVTISGCSPTPTSFAGDATSHSITMSPSCSFTLSLPSGYQFTGGSGTTTCSSGTCPTYITSYESVPAAVTQPIVVGFNDVNGPPGARPVTISGCNASPSSFQGDGNTYSITMSSSCSFTLSLPSGSQFIGGSGTTTCSSGICSIYSTYYDSVPNSNSCNSSFCNIAFIATGLPLGSQFAVWVPEANNLFYLSDTTFMDQLPAGNYHFTIYCFPSFACYNYTPTPQTGQFTSPTTSPIAISFANTPPPRYSVTFTESGESGSSWSVDFPIWTSTTPTSSNSITFTNVANGLYGWEVYNPPSGCTSNPPARTAQSLTVSGANVNIPITFTCTVPSVSIGPSSATIDADGVTRATFTATPSGGSGSYGSYAWTVPSGLTTFSGCTSSSTTCTVTSTTLGSYTLSVTVTDSKGATSSPSSAIVTVNSALTAPTAPAVSAASLNAGQALTVTGTIPSTGTSPYSWQWSVSVNGGAYSAATQCATGNGSGASAGVTETCSIAANTLTVGATYTFELTVTDSASAPATKTSSASSMVTISGALNPGNITPSSPPIDNGQSVTLTANPSGGTLPYTYQWYTGGSCTNPIPGATSSTYTASPSTTTTYYYKATDSASSPSSMCSLGDTVTVNSALSAGAITPSSQTIGSGQSVILTANPSGGTTPYTYQWYTGASCTNQITGAASPTYSASPSSTTTYYYKITDSAYSPVSACSAGDTVSVSSSLTAGTVTPANPAIDGGQSISLTANPSGGTAPYTYQWYTSSSCSTSPISGATSQSVSVTPTSTTTYYYKVTDSASATSCSVGDIVAVNSVLGAGAIAPISPTVDNGQSITLTASPTGGTPSYLYQWYSGVGCTSPISGATSSAYVVSPTSTTAYEYKVTDSAQGSPSASACSTADTVTVNSALVVGAVTPPSPTVNNGQSVTLTANPSGGTQPYNYQWYTGAGCTNPIAGATGQAYTTSPTATTTYYYKVTDSSYSAASICSAGDTVTITSTITAGAITPSNPAIDNGQSITLAANPSGGIPPYTYQWYTDASCTNQISGATSLTFSTSPSSTTTYYYKVTDSSSPALSSCSSGDTVTVDSVLGTATVTPSTSAVDRDQSVTVQVSWTGGASPYGITLYRGPSSSCSSDTTLVGTATGQTSSRYTFSGQSGLTLTSTTYFCVTVTDSSTGTPAAATTSSAAQVAVNSQFTGSTVTISSLATTINRGQSATLTVSWQSAGTQPYNVQLTTSSSTSCSSPSIYVTPVTGIAGTSAKFSVSPASSTIYCATVTDGGSPPESASTTIGVMITVTVVKSSSTTAVNCSPSSVVAGSTVTCVATVTGSPSGPEPTGQVSFSSSSATGSFTGNPCTLVSGTCSAQYSDSSQGTYTMSANYIGDPNYNPSSSPTPSTITVTLPPSITSPSSLPGTETTAPYHYQFLATGGTPSYTWSTNGAITNSLGKTLATFGLSLSSTGVLSGTPTYSGTIYFQVMVTDQSGQSNPGLFSLNINKGPQIPCPGNVCVPIVLPAATEGTAYSSYSLPVQYGAGDFNWSVTGGSLPPAMSLSSQGVVSGIPTATGSYTFTATVVDILGGTASQAFTIDVTASSTYEITFEEVGLPTGWGWCWPFWACTVPEWSVTLNGQTSTSTSPLIIWPFPTTTPASMRRAAAWWSKT